MINNNIYNSIVKYYENCYKDNGDNNLGDKDKVLKKYDYIIMNGVFTIYNE